MIDKDKVMEAVASSIKDKIGKGIGVKVPDDFYTELAESALTAIAKALPNLKPSTLIDVMPTGWSAHPERNDYPSKALPDCDNALANYNEILQWGKDD